MYINLFYVVRHKKIKANLTSSYFNFQRRLGRLTSVHFQVLMVKKQDTSITVTESQFVKIIIFNHVTKKKVNWIVL